ncbi:MAG: hypothetical protein WBW55_13340 [Desulfobaccales bacterium]
MFNENTRNILLNGSEQEIKGFIMSLSQPDSMGYKVAVDFLLFKYNKNLIKKTCNLVIATWVLAILNVFLVLKILIS